MYGAPELDLAFDVDDIAGSDARSRGDADRVAVAELAQVGNGKPIDLADAFAARVDQQRVALDRIDDPGLQATEPPAALANRFADVPGIDLASTALPSPVVSLFDQVLERAHVHREPFAVVSVAGPLLDYTLNGADIERQQLP